MGGFWGVSTNGVEEIEALTCGSVMACHILPAV